MDSVAHGAALLIMGDDAQRRGEQPADALLVERVRSGAEDAFDELVARFQGPLYGYLLGFVGDRESAQDLLQETFLRAFRSIGELSDGAMLRSWLYRIAHNQACSLLRRRRLLSWLPLPLLPDQPAAQSTGFESARVREVLGRISADQRSPLLLHLVAGLSHAEIAALLGISEGAVRMRISRGRALFRTLYEDDDAS